MKTDLRFGSFLVRNGILAEGHVNEALQNQSFLGGRLGTNLVESGHLTLAQLEDSLARFYAVPCVTHTHVKGINPQLLQSMPMRLIRKYSFLPLRKTEQELVIASLEPANPDMLREIGGIIGMRVRSVICSEIRMYYYLHEFYGMEPDIRFRPLFLKYLHSETISRGRQESREQLVQQGFKPLERGEELTEEGFEDELLRQTLKRNYSYTPPPTAPTAPPAPVVAASTPPPVPVPPASAQPMQRVQAAVPPASPPIVEANAADLSFLASLPEASRQKMMQILRRAQNTNQLINLEDLDQLLPELNDREQIIEFTLRYICQHIEACVLFVVHDGMAMGWDGRSRNPIRKFSRDIIRLMIFPLAADSFFKTVFESKNHFHGRPSANAINSRLLAALGLPASHEVLLVPVYVKKRLINFLFIDNGHEEISRTQVSLVLDLARWLSRAYEHIILARKKDFTQNLNEPH